MKFKKDLKKKITWVKISNTRPRLWKWDKLIEKKKKNNEAQFSANSMLADEIEKNYLKRRQNKNLSLPKLVYQSYDPNHEIGMSFIKTWVYIKRESRKIT